MSKHKFGFEKFGINHPANHNCKRMLAPQHLYVPPSSYDDKENHEDEDLNNIEYDQSYSLDRPITGGDKDDDKIEIFDDPVYDNADEEEIALDEALIEDQKPTLSNDNQQHGSSIDEVRDRVNWRPIYDEDEIVDELVSDPILCLDSNVGELLNQGIVNTSGCADASTAQETSPSKQAPSLVQNFVDHSDDLVSIGMMQQQTDLSKDIKNIDTSVVLEGHEQMQTKVSTNETKEIIDNCNLNEGILVDEGKQGSQLALQQYTLLQYICLTNLFSQTLYQLIIIVPISFLTSCGRILEGRAPSLDCCVT